MDAIASKRRSQPAPPWVIFDDLVDPDRQPCRPWLHLEDDEIAPAVLESERPSRVVWSSLWLKCPDARIAFDLTARADGGTDLRWTLLVEPPAPDDRRFRHLCQRIGTLINANLRHTYGQ
ncbi:MAG TPA: hypothetical protein DIW80_12145 [Gordonia polyisoprenivorans]|uniref:hypothetical protein n=1 Tax=Gordonia TaxID=2053 RepID=UPI0009AEF7FC|nr:hypothetical protein [Gordonia sp. i37]MBE7191456.1 hypothetical protein [Gordonia polyisoprenivorans]OPX15227.1 hypothetical protein B1964_11030 [Gordonia sp. i37]UZF53857.1 hypothetical protein LH935_13825 [Gordonia polyisoprenivorans]HCS57859.1 hypothetical protein [Gordonia polyisoprenivorans]